MGAQTLIPKRFFYLKNMITLFRGITDTKNPFYRDVNEVLLEIKKSENKTVYKIRSEPDKENRNKLKLTLDSICFSGKFSQRGEKYLIEHSGFACLDFDEIEKPKEFRDSLKTNQYIYSAFISPSGNGVKALVKVPKEKKDYKAYYAAISETFDCTNDPHTSNIASVCFISNDNGLWINENSKEWVLKSEFERVTINNDYPKYFLVDGKDKRVEVIMKWFQKKFTLGVGERNSNLFKLAAALNEAGATYDECINIIDSYFHSGLTDDEIQKLVHSAYRKIEKHNTLQLVDTTKVEKARNLITKGEKKLKTKLKQEGLNDSDIEDVIDFEYPEDYLVFWDLDKNGKPSLNDYKFKLFLENRGFFKVHLNQKEFTFVNIYNNIVKEVNETIIKDYVLEYVIEKDQSVYNFFARSTAKFSENYLTLLSSRELSMLRDTHDTSYLFFKNKILKVVENNIEKIDYLDSGGLIWERNIIKHNFKEDNEICDFEKFIDNVTANDPKRKLILECSMGYLMNTYKKQNEGVAIILYDETLSDNPSGRTGKTVISKAIGQLRKLVTLNGKEFNNKGQFPYQTVNLDDNVLCFDDLTRSFKFEELFSLITGDLTLNKKNLQPIVIPYHKSPKILFTSNYILSGTGDSHDARKIEIELFRHYSKSYEPKDEFGRLFFSNDWDESEWDRFFSYMIFCIRQYFTNGLIKNEMQTGGQRKLIANTNEDFVEYFENEFIFNESENYQTKNVYHAYINGERELPSNMNMKWFGRWLSMYFDFKEWTRKDEIINGLRTFRIEKNEF